MSFNNALLRAKDSVASTLTAAYAGNTHTFNVDGYNQMTIYIEHTPAENNAVLEVKIETGMESDDFHEKVSKNTGTSNITLYLTPFKRTAPTSGTADKYAIPVELCDVWVRISFKETSTSKGTINFALVCSNT